MPPTKENPLEAERRGYRTGKVTLFLDREGMLEAEENFFNAYWESVREDNSSRADMVEERVVWNTSWAAAIAAFSFLMEGRISPK